MRCQSPKNYLQAIMEPNKQHDNLESSALPLDTMAIDVPVPGTRTKADLGKRIIAALIDGLIAGVVGFIPIIGGLAGAAYMLVRDGLELDFMDGRSIGKKAMGIRPVQLDGSAMDISASVKRNIPCAIAPLIMIVPILGWIIGPPVGLVIAVIELVLVLTDQDGRRMGDKFAGTMVVDD